MGVVIVTWKENTLLLQGKFNQKHLKALYNPLYESVMSFDIVHCGEGLCTYKTDTSTAEQGL